MRFRTKNLLAALGLAASLISPALGQEPFQPTSMNHGRRDPIPVVPSAPAESCPAPTPGMPGAMPSTIPGAMPGTPGAPVTPAIPGTPAPATPAPGAEGPVPGVMTPYPGAAAVGAFGAAPSAGTGGSSTFNPSMFGDLLSPSRVVFATPGSPGTPSTVVFRRGALPTTLPGTPGTTSFRSIPVLSDGSFKISDNGSPKPQDRAYVTYNYFNDPSGPSGPSGDVNRETLGLEKTFLCGNASVGLRLPFTESSSSLGGLGDGTMGDLTLYGIYAFLNDRETGNVLSTGFALTLPTGPAFRDPTGRDLNDVIYQPFFGYIYNFNRDFYIEGFHSAIVSEHQCGLSQDVSLGWWMYRSNDGNLRGIVPTVELHLYTPLDNTSTYVSDQIGTSSLISDNTLTITTGVTFLIGDRISVGVAVGVPVTGPRPDSYEAITTFNWRF
jgi:hypothetical protein